MGVGGSPLPDPGVGLGVSWELSFLSGVGRCWGLYFISGGLRSRIQRHQRLTVG